MLHPPISRTTTSRWALHRNGILLTIVLIIAIEGLTRVGVRIPTPGVILLLPVAYTAFTGGLRTGLVDAALMFGTPDQSLSDVQVVVTNRLTELISTVTNSRGEPSRDYTLLVFPDDRERWYAGSRYFRRVAPQPAGYATVRGLPPGNYFVAPVFGMSVLKDGADAWQDPEFLESIAQRATRATLSEGQKLTINARVITP